MTMTTDRLRDAARRALDSLNDLIADSSDPGTEALGARFELETALTNTPVPPPTNRAALLHETADVRPQTLTSVAAHLDARAVAILRPDSQTFAEWQAIAALLRRVAAEEQPAETQDRDRDAIIAELLPAWEAVYEPGNVSNYLIGYANDQDAATGMAEAWMRSQAEVAGRLEWESWGTATAMPDGYDAWFELVERHDDGIDTGPGIIVRRRIEPAVGEQPDTQEAS